MTNLDSGTRNPDRIPQFTLGDRLRKARESQGLDMQEIAALIDIHRQSVARYESDQATPKRHVLLSWSYATGVDLGWIQSGTVSTHDEQSTHSTDYGSKGFPRFASPGIPGFSYSITTESD